MEGTVKQVVFITPHSIVYLDQGPQEGNGEVASRWGEGCLLGFVTPTHGDVARGHGVEREWD